MALLPPVSCTNEVETIWSDDNAPILVLNAQIHQEDAHHTLFVYCSEKSHCDPLGGATVICSVNSKPVAVEEQDKGAYVFASKLAAGDIIDFKVTWKTLSATARAEVPEPVGEITGVTVTDVTIENDETSWQRRLESVAFKDRPDANDYYMLSIEDVYNRLDDDGNIIESISTRVSIDASDDKVLNPMGAEMTEFLDYDNDFNIFTDEMFADASYTFKLYPNEWAVYSAEWVDFMGRFSDGDKYTIDRVYKVYSLTFDEFLYLKAITAQYNNIELMTEPVIFPENVTGGLGFVAAMSPVSRVVTRGPFEFDGNYYDY